MPDLVDRLEGKMRRHILAEMPPDSSGELASKSLADLLLVHGNWRSRFVPPTPRIVQVSNALSASPKLAEHRAAIEAISAKSIAGDDLTPHLSRGIKVAYVPSSQAPAELKRRRDRDLLIADWGIHHLHLTTTVEGDGFVKRTDDLLFAAFANEDVYLLGIHPHGSWGLVDLVGTLVQNWPESGLFTKLAGLRLAQPISEDERLEARQGGVFQPIEVAGDLYSPPGLTVAGTPVRVTSQVNAIMWSLAKWRENLDARLPNTEDGKFLYWLPAIVDGSYGFRAGSRFVPVATLPWKSA